MHQNSQHNKNMSLNYKKRIADDLLSELLEAVGGVLIQGTKWCGKTTTAAHLAKSVIYMDDPEFKQQYLTLAKSRM